MRYQLEEVVIIITVCASQIPGLARPDVSKVGDQKHTLFHQISRKFKVGHLNK